MEVAPMVALHSYVAQPFFMEKEQYEEDYYECIDKVDTQMQEAGTSDERRAGR